MWDFYFILRILLAGIFTYLYCRLMKLGRAASLAASFIFMYTGHFLLYVHIHHVDAEILIPLVLLCTELLVRRRSIGNALALGVAFGVMQFGGCPPEASFAIAFFATAYFLFRSLTIIGLRKDLLPLTGYFGLAGFIGILISLPATAPFLELLRNSSHGHDQSGLFHLLSSQSIFLFIPFFSGEHSFVLPYVGMIAPTFALMAFGSKENRSLAWFFWGFILFFLVRTFGLYGTNWVGELPLFRLTLFPKYFFSSFLFSLSVGAAIGIEYAVSDERKWRFIILGLLSVPIFLMTFLAIYRDPIAALGKTELALRQIGIACSITLFLTIILIGLIRWKFPASLAKASICILLFGELFFYSFPLDYPYRASQFPQAPYLEFLGRDHSLFRIFSLQGVLPPNSSSVMELSDIGVNNAIFISRYIKLMQRAINPACGYSTPPNYGRPNISGRLLDLLNVKYLIGKTLLPLPGSRFSLVYNREVKIYQNLRSMPRAFLVYRWEIMDDDSEILNRMLSDKFDFRNSVLLEEKPAVTESQTSESLLPPNSPPEVLRYAADEVVIRAAPVKNGILVLTDSFFPGWKAEVDGKEVKLLRADYLFRGVYLNAGEHTVRFRYSPLSTLIPCVISLGTLMCIGVWCMWKYMRFARERREMKIDTAISPVPAKYGKQS